MVNIFIANLDWDIKSEDLKTTFEAFGPVAYAHVVFDNKTRKSKGFGYVEMEDTDHAIAAIQALNGMEVNDRTLDVKIASPKSNRPEKKAFVKKPFEKKPFRKFDNNRSAGGGQSSFNKPSAWDKLPSKEDLANRSSESRPSESRPSESRSFEKPSESKPERVFRPRRKNQ